MKRSSLRMLVGGVALALSCTGCAMLVGDLEVNEEACGSAGAPAIVDDVTPTTATLNQLTIFTISGKCLPSTIAPTISQCIGLRVTDIGANKATFQCRPSVSTGSKPGEVKAAVGGSTLYQFTVDVAPGSPIVTDVQPTVVNYGDLTEFTIDGFGMPSTIAPFITNCAGLTVTDAGVDRATFQCTPSFFTGVQSGIVKDKPGGTELYNFTVSVN